jgi:tRNA1(Val) A37 N6-methylase TrmN6
VVCQREKGYRFSVDAPILAGFLPYLPAETALEIGAGSGIVSLLALYKKKFSAISGIEVQPSLSELATMNAEKNRLAHRFAVTTGDFNEVYRDFTGVRHVFSNPPYFATNRGRLSPNPEIRDAKTETRLTLEQVLVKSYEILGKEGNLYLVLPFARFNETMELAQKTGFFCGRLRQVFSFKDGRQERFLVQLTNYNVSSKTLSPLIIFKDKGIYTEEMERILSGE